MDRASCRAAAGKGQVQEKEGGAGVTEKIVPERNRSEVEIIQGWWRNLFPQKAKMQEPDEVGTRKPAPRRGNPAALARLRRAATPHEALMCSETVRLAHALGLSSGDQRIGRVAVLAATLAHVKKESRDRFASALGSGGDHKVMSSLRFQRLIDAQTDQELLDTFRRALTMLKGTASVRDLADSLLNWGDERRQRWIYDYYQASFAAPTAEDSQSDAPDPEDGESDDQTKGRSDEENKL
jgi:CRISPR type I-E-associated protein CasB/Cse2